MRKTFKRIAARHRKEKHARSQSSEQSVPAADADQKLTVVPAESSSQLCKICIEFAKWLSVIDYGSGSYVRNTHQMRKDQDHCQLCRLLTEPITSPWLNPTYVSFGGEWDINGLLTCVYTDRMCLAVHTDQGRLAPRISSLPPVPMKPCLANYSRIMSWMSICVHKHNKCGKFETRLEDGTWETTLPRRVIDVGQEDERMVRLVETSNQLGHYCTLSHCWGVEKPLMTTGETYGNHLSGIPMEDLPKTFRHAVEITRGIGIRYLWIDSLCIIQGDRHDWHREAEKMAMVYGRAMLTIAASSAVDSTQGCFFPPHADIAPVRVPYYSYKTVTGHIFLSQPTEGEVNESRYLDGLPLRSRAWAFQEWWLSTRVLHCTKGGLFWTCKEIALNDRNVELYSTIGQQTGWGKIVEFYSETQLTFPDDRLIALQGIIKAIQATRRAQNFFGIWDDEIQKGLLWYTIKSDRFMTGVDEVPSWSWAAKDGGKCFLESLDKTPQSLETVRAGFYGSENRVIALEGQGDSCDCLYWDGEMLCHPEGLFTYDSPRIRVIRAKRMGELARYIGIASMDLDNVCEPTIDMPSIESPEMLFMSMFTSKRVKFEDFLVRNPSYSFNCCCNADRCVKCKILGTPKDEAVYWGLLLEPTSNGTDRYRRVGMGMLWTKPVGPVRKIYIE